MSNTPPQDSFVAMVILDATPNFHVDISARCAELGRPPYATREFFLRYPDRILFGSDLIPDVNMHFLYFRFLGTRDSNSGIRRAPRVRDDGTSTWFLPDKVLRRVYRDNALRVLP